MTGLNKRFGIVPVDKNSLVTILASNPAKIPISEIAADPESGYLYMVLTDSSLVEIKGAGLTDLIRHIANLHKITTDDPIGEKDADFSTTWYHIDDIKHVETDSEKIKLKVQYDDGGVKKWKTLYTATTSDQVLLAGTTDETLKDRLDYIASLPTSKSVISGKWVANPKDNVIAVGIKNNSMHALVMDYQGDTPRDFGRFHIIAKKNVNGCSIKVSGVGPIEEIPDVKFYASANYIYIRFNKADVSFAVRDDSLNLEQSVAVDSGVLIDPVNMDVSAVEFKPSMIEYTVGLISDLDNIKVSCAGNINTSTLNIPVIPGWSTGKVEVMVDGSVIYQNLYLDNNTTLKRVSSDGGDNWGRYEAMGSGSSAKTLITTDTPHGYTGGEVVTLVDGVADIQLGFAGTPPVQAQAIVSVLNATTMELIRFGMLDAGNMTDDTGATLEAGHYYFLSKVTAGKLSKINYTTDTPRDEDGFTHQKILQCVMDAGNKKIMVDISDPIQYDSLYNPEDVYVPLSYLEDHYYNKGAIDAKVKALTTEKFNELAPTVAEGIGSAYYDRLCNTLNIAADAWTKTGFYPYMVAGYITAPYITLRYKNHTTYHDAVGIDYRINGLLCSVDDLPDSSNVKCVVLSDCRTNIHTQYDPVSFRIVDGELEIKGSNGGYVFIEGVTPKVNLRMDGYSSIGDLTIKQTEQIENLFEFGSNANGWYKKWDSGLLEQWGSGIANMTVPESLTIYNDLPISFANESYYANAVHVGGNAAVNIILGNRETGRVAFETSHSTDVKVAWFAIGLWK